MREKEKVSMTDWDRLEAMTDEDIDYSDDPPTDEAFWKNAKVVYPRKKAKVTMNLDQEVLHFFRKQGKGYQVKINAVLKAYVQAHS